MVNYRDFMNVMYLVKDSKELEKLEKIMEKFPFLILPENIDLKIERSDMGPGVIITPSYKNISGIAGVDLKPNGDTLSIDWMAYRESPPHIAVKSKGNFYILNLKALEKP